MSSAEGLGEVQSNRVIGSFMGLRGLYAFEQHSFELHVEFYADESSLGKHHASEKDRSLSGIITGFDLLVWRGNNKYK